MNTTSVAQEGSGMQNVDPARPSPIVEAFTTMLANQAPSNADLQAMQEALDQHPVHASWCDHDVQDETHGRVCSTGDYYFVGLTESGSLGAEGPPWQPTVTIDLNYRSEADRVALLALSPDEARTLLRILRGASGPTADTLKKLLDDLDADPGAIR
jgi:hypothetical protein